MAPLCPSIFRSLLIGLICLALLLPTLLVVFIAWLVIKCIAKCCPPADSKFQTKITMRWLFYPITYLLCFIREPWIRLSNGYTLNYLGTLSRTNTGNVNAASNIKYMRLRDFNNNKDLDYSSLRDNNKTRIICISDTHQRHDWVTRCLPYGDILIHCGDMTIQGRGFEKFYQWFSSLPYKYKIVISGNHDQMFDGGEKRTIEDRGISKGYIRKHYFHYKCLKDIDDNDLNGSNIIDNDIHLKENVIYLENDGVIIKEFSNLTIFGCPWSIYQAVSVNKGFQFTIELPDEFDQRKTNYRATTFRTNENTMRDIKEFEGEWDKIINQNGNGGDGGNDENGKKVDILLTHSDITTLYADYEKIFGDGNGNGDGNGDNNDVKNVIDKGDAPPGGREIIEKFHSWKPSMSFCGHLHHEYGVKYHDKYNMLVTNCSSMSLWYQPSFENSPIVFDVDLKSSIIY